MICCLETHRVATSQKNPIAAKWQGAVTEIAAKQQTIDPMGERLTGQRLHFPCLVFLEVCAVISPLSDKTTNLPFSCQTMTTNSSSNINRLNQVSTQKLTGYWSKVGKDLHWQALWIQSVSMNSDWCTLLPRISRSVEDSDIKHDLRLHKQAEWRGGWGGRWRGGGGRRKGGGGGGGGGGRGGAVSILHHGDRSTAEQHSSVCQLKSKPIIAHPWWAFWWHLVLSPPSYNHAITVNTTVEEGSSIWIVHHNSHTYTK